MKNFVFIFYAIIILLISCGKETNYYPVTTDSTDTIKTVFILNVNKIKLTTATCSGGLISANNKNSIIAIGFCWNDYPKPSINNLNRLFYNKTLFDDILITNLKPNTDYYLCTIIISMNDTIYGNDLNFKTWDGKINDAEGNTYQGIQINDQCWMAENLRTAHYPNGSKIDKNSYCWYGQGHDYGSDMEADLNLDKVLDKKDSEIYVNKFGLLYTWYVSSDVCPTGWHLPSRNEWDKLFAFINNDASVLKSDSLWLSNSGTDKFGFDALPGGFRFKGEYSNLYYSTSIQSSTESDNVNAYCAVFESNSNYARLNMGGKDGYNSVRCIKDE